MSYKLVLTVLTNGKPDLIITADEKALTKEQVLKILDIILVPKE